MRVAWITTGFLRNESEYDGVSFMHNLAKGISSVPEIDLNIFSLYYPVGRDEYSFYNAKVFLSRYKGIKTVSVPKLDKLKSIIRCIKKFKKEHLKKKFDIIHSIWSGESGYVASYLSRKYNIPLVANIGGGELAEIPRIKYGSRLKFWQKKFINKTFVHAKVIVTGSNYITGRIKSYYSYEIYTKIAEIPFGVDENKFFQVKKNNVSEVKLINIATAVPVKSHIDLFKALKIVKEKYPEIILECYGRDDDNILKGLVEEMDLSGSVRLKGFIEYDKIPDALHKADIFVLSSLYESQNMAVLEAAFCGLPVVSTDVGIAPQVTLHIVNPGDYKALAEKILYVIGNPDMEYQNLYEKFSLESSVNKFIRLYTSIVEKQPFHK